MVLALTLLVLLGVSSSPKAATVLDGSVTLPDGQAALCGGDVPLTGCVFFIDPVLGSPVNDGMSIASPWDCDTLNTAVLPAGARVVVMDDTVDSDCTITVDWTVDATTQNIVTTAYLDSADNTVRYFDGGTGGSRGQKAEISFVDYRTVANRDHIDVRDIKLTRKWTPGFWIQDKEGRHGNKILDDSNQAKRHNFWGSFSGDTAIKGFSFVGEWGNIVKTDGDYSLVSEIIEDLDFLATLATKKMYILQMRTQTFGNGNTACPTDDAPPTEFYSKEHPRFLWFDHALHDGHADVCANANNTQAVLRLWDPEIEADYIDFIEELGDRLDSHPNFEALILNHETSTGNGLPGSADPTYDKVAYREALKRIALAARAAFPRSSVALQINFKMGDNPDKQTTMDDLVAWAQANGIGLGAPDTGPNCLGVDPQSQDVADSLCPSGFPDKTTDPHSITAHNSVLNDLADGQIPMYFRYAADEMGGGARVGNDAGYHPSVIGDFWNEMDNTHGIVIWNESNHHTYQWATDVYPYIQANPNKLTNTDCPTSSCK